MKALKSVLLVTVVFCSLSLFTNLEVFASEINNNINIEQVDPAYEVVELESLTVDVQSAIKEIEKEFNLVKIEFNKEKALTRLSVVDKDNSENITMIYLNEKGEKVLPTEESVEDLNPNKDLD